MKKGRLVFWTVALTAVMSLQVSISAVSAAEFDDEQVMETVPVEIAETDSAEEEEIVAEA